MGGAGTLSVRLKALLPAWMPWIRKRFKLSPAIEKQLLSISPRQDGPSTGRQEEPKEAADLRTHQAGLSAQAPHPVKTDSWDVKSPGFTEVDLVSHSGNSGEGEFGYSLNITDISNDLDGDASAAGERGKPLCRKALDEIEGMLPFRLLAWTRTTDRNSSTGICRLGANGNRSNSREDVRTRRTTTLISSKRTDSCTEATGLERYDTQNAVEAMNDLYRESCAYG